MKKSLLILSLAVAFVTGADAVVSDIDNVIYGSITLGGVAVTAANTNIFVAARLQPAGQLIATYTMGSRSGPGDLYSIRISVETGIPSAPDAVQAGQVIYLDVDDASGIRAQTSFTVGQPGQVTRLEFNGPNTGQTIFPADNNPANQTISISEVVAYTLAWRQGTPWSASPANIPVSFAVRAGALWRGGGVYTINGTVGAAPAWWLNTNAAPPAPITNLYSAVCSMPANYVPGVPLSISETVTPAPGVTTYAVEDQPPAGWTVVNISAGGAFDPVNGKVKWGLFFDSAPRTLTYQVTPPTNAIGAAVFGGQASFDGFVTLNISGARSINYQPPPSFGALPLGLGKSFHIGLQGAVGDIYVIEASSNLTIWNPIATNVIDASQMGSFFEPINTNINRFYRVLRRSQ